MATSSLPPNWTLVLEEIQHTLTQAVQSAETREAGFARATDPAKPLVFPDVLTNHFDKLEKRVQQIEAPLAKLDETLQAEEEHVRQHLARVADLSHRLAEWVGGAIG